MCSTLYSTPPLGLTYRSLYAMTGRKLLVTASCTCERLKPKPETDPYPMKSGTVHDHAAVNGTNAFPARSVIVAASVIANTAGSAKEVRSLIAMVAVVPSELRFTVVAAAVPAIFSVTEDDVSELFAIASENVTVMGARRTI